MERSRHGANRAWVDLSPPGRTVMSMKKEWLTRKDLAEMLSVSKSTIERLTTSPEFPTPIRVGGLLRYNAREVDRYLKTLREPQPPRFRGVPRTRSRRGRQVDPDFLSKFKFTD